MPLKFVRNDITRMGCDAIVNTANEKPAVGRGCDMAIYQAAGYEQLLAYRREHIGTAREGSAFLTPGFSLSARFIIHVVSPRYRGGNRGEERKLRLCYRNAFSIARKQGFQSIAFPLISTGSYGYPKEEGLRIAVDEINAALLHYPMQVYLVVYDESAVRLGRRIDPFLEEYIGANYTPPADLSFGIGAASKNAPVSENTVHYQEQSEITGIWEPDDFYSDTDNSVGRDIFDGFYGNEEAAKPGSGFVSRRSEAPRLSGEAPRRSEAPQSAPHRPEASQRPQALQRSEAPRPVESFSPRAASLPQQEQELDEELSGKLEERIRHLSDTFSEYLLYLIASKGMTNAEVYKRGIVDKKVFSKIKNNKDAHPKKITAMCLCVGARLNIDETRDLLARAGYALSPCDMTDTIFSYFIENHIYDMVELDIQLEEHGLPCLIT